MKAIRFVCLVVALAALAPSTVRAQDESILVDLRVVGTDVDRDGSYGEATVVASGAISVAAGEEGFVYLASDSFSSSGMPQQYGLCNNASGGDRADRAPARKAWLLERAAHAWWAIVRGRSIEVGKIEIEVDWEHWVSARRGSARKVAGDVRRIVLPEGGRHILDFVDEEPTPDSYCYRNLTIEIAAEVREDPAFADRRLAYDLWYEHRDAAGNVQHRRFQSTGKQGETVETSLAPLRIPVPASQLPPGISFDSILEITAAMQGRLRADGRIEVRFSAGRFLGGAPPGVPRSGGIGDGGKTVLLVDPGEPIRLELPVPTGAHTDYVTVTDPGGAARKVAVKVDSPTFYRGSTDRLILTVRPVY